MDKLNYVLYARKSTEDSSKQIQSIDDQKKYWKDVVDREGLKIIDTISESKSAKEPYVREGFKELIRLIESGKVNAVLVWKFDRLSRNPIDTATLQYLLQKRKLLCIRTCERTYLPEDNALLMAVEGGMSNQYVRDLSANVKRGVHSKAEKGHFPNIPPIGYLNSKLRDKGNECILVDEDRFPIIRKGWDLILTGNYTIPKVYDILVNEYGLRTPNRKKLGGRKPALSYFYHMFNNIFFTGQFEYGGKTYVGKHKAMITTEEFERVQVIIGNRAKPRSHTLEFAYNGIMHCPDCGGMITATEKKKFVKSTKDIAKYVYYHCTRRIRKPDGTKCQTKYIPVADIEKQFINILDQHQIDQDFYDLALEVLKDNHQDESLQREVVHKNFLQNRADVQRKLDNALQFLLDGTITKSEYERNKLVLDKELQRIDAKIRDHDNNASTDRKITENAIHFLKYAKDVFTQSNLSLQTKREIFNSIGLNYRLKDENLLVDIHSWLVTVKNGQKECKGEIARFEPQKNLVNKKENTDFSVLLPKLCGEKDLNLRSP